MKKKDRKFDITLINKAFVALFTLFVLANMIVPSLWAKHLANEKKFTGIRKVDKVLVYLEKDKPKNAGLIEIDGAYYYAGDDGKLAVNGYHTVTKTNRLLPKGNYIFDKKGVLIRGEVREIDGKSYFYKDGMPYDVGLIERDGEYYCTGSTGQLRTSGYYSVTKPNKLVSKGSYTFDEEGKMIRGEITEINGVLYFCRDGKPYEAGLFQIGKDYYYAGADGKLAVSGVHTVTKTNGLRAGGDFNFDARGRMIRGRITEIDGVLYFCRDDEPYYAGLIQLNGEYYYADAEGKLAVGCGCWVANHNGMMPGGYYSFDENGRMIRGDITEVDGVAYFYRDGMPYDAGIFRTDEAYYYADSDGKLVSNCRIWITKTNGILPEGGYAFGPDGKMIDGEITEINGKRYFYRNGVPYAAGLVLLDGYYYYADTDGALVSFGDYRVTNHNGLVPEGVYTFASDGRMNLGQIVEKYGDLYYYVNGEPYSAGLIRQDGAYYYVRSNGKLVVNSEYWAGNTHGLLLPGNYNFDEEGKLIAQP